ncbi:MAG: M28 family peptidase [Drouetiella hepatica Uher 2000/2452]|jgi:hypothetical protein|uniref:M28 family peptidase n=1 Tax=Drouetiella hepatica Uher 2000/2452 TaxID=904376 RepID=A0A951UPC2_9CYAN|nr:M28 family peptidase [Drouetiella hepatica Uher 2000/2452]
MKPRSLLLILLAAILSILVGWHQVNPRSPAAAEYPQVAPPAVDSQKLWADVEALSFKRFEESDRQKARDYIMQELQSAGWTPKLQEFQAQGLSGINILAERSGTNPQLGAILLGAHYDTIALSPGADDNATGVAAVLAAARLLGQNPTPRSLQLAFFDLEEEGLLGSQAFVETLQPDLIQGAMIMDMIGYTCRTAGCQTYPPLPIKPPVDKGEFLAAIGDQGHPDLTQSLSQAGRGNLPQVLTLSIPTLSGLAPDLVRSDHTPFWKKGIGAVLLTDTANFRNPHYHQPSDRLETIDRDFFVGSAQIVINAVTDLLQK